MLTQRGNVHNLKTTQTVSYKVKQRRDIQELPAAELQEFKYCFSRGSILIHFCSFCLFNKTLHLDSILKVEHQHGGRKWLLCVAKQIGHGSSYALLD